MKKNKDLKSDAQRLIDRVELEISNRSGGAKKVSRDKALRLLTKLGVPFDDRQSPEHTGVHWDGSLLATKGFDASDLFHELAHIQCAPVSSFQYPDFGLGLGPKGVLSVAQGRFEVSTRHGPWRQGSRDAAAVDEEIAASLLGILWERSYKGPFWNTLCAHCWGGLDAKDRWEWENEDNWQHAAKLMKLGLINGAGRPNLVLRDGSKQFRV